MLSATLRRCVARTFTAAARSTAAGAAPATLTGRSTAVLAAVAPRGVTQPSFVVATRSYHENIVDHYENPRNVGSLDKSAEDVGTGIVGAPACGDVMKLQIQVDDDGVVVDAKFKTFGCGSAIASSSVATEWIRGKSLDEAVKLKNKDIAAHLKLPPVKLHCSMLAEDAIKAAVKDYQKKHEAKKSVQQHQ